MCLLQIKSWSQTLIGDIDKSIETGKLELLEEYMETIVDLSINDKTSTYSRSQAAMVISDFLKKNKTQSFEITNVGVNGDNIYYIGYLDTKVTNYHIYIYTKKKPAKEVILEIRIKKV